MDGFHNIGEGVGLANDTRISQGGLQFFYVGKRFRLFEQFIPLQFKVHEKRYRFPGVHERFRAGIGFRRSHHGVKGLVAAPFRPGIYRVKQFFDGSGPGRFLLNRVGDDRQAGPRRLGDVRLIDTRAQTRFEVLRIGLDIRHCGFGHQCQIRHIGAAKMLIQNTVRHADGMGGLEPSCWIVIYLYQADAIGGNNSDQGGDNEHHPGPCIGKSANAGK
ncbi:MAG: hypothetical protein BWY09_02264 [Candidatus Hydrogenedentes bacterium ADurb.Bin179]|nr:MAG: hypothetical protein BWY09_02264 [Candidatus Hydrogenedentes bacterium ADurb.Bin179]